MIALLAISVGFHEAAHAWVALKCGDTTGRDLGRITLNPFPHIDLFMTIILPLIFYLMTSGKMIFGGAKPVPVNFYNLRQGHRHMALVALAGPVSNFLLAFLFYVLLQVVVGTMHWQGTVGQRVLEMAVRFNLLLTAFNLLPIPPLDGSRVMTWLLPTGIRESYARMESFGLILILVAISIPSVNRFLWQTMDMLLGVIRGLASPILALVGVA